MSRSITSSDRAALIRLASELPKGSPEREAILAGLKEASRDINFIEDFNTLSDRFLRRVAEIVAKETGGTVSSDGKQVTWPDAQYIYMGFGSTLPFTLEVRGSVRPFKSAVHTASGTAKHIVKAIQRSQ